MFCNWPGSSASTSTSLPCGPLRVTIFFALSTAEVIAVDPAKKMVTLKGPQGNEVDVEAEDPGQLQNIKKGDHVQVTYVEALAISVKEAKAAK